MPLSYGGWVRSMEDVKELFRAGFEKVIFNSALLETPDLIRDAVAFAGAQSIVASIDFKKNFLGKTECFAECGKRNTKRTITEYVKYVEELGAGEIFLNSIDRDGMMNGYDYSVIKEVSAITKVPVICCGGAGNLSDMAKAVKESGAHAVAAGSLFVFFGPRKAVLINYPKEDEQRAAGLFE